MPLKFLVIGPGHHNHGYLRIDPANRLKGFDSIHSRHVEVEQNDRGPTDLKATEGFESAVGSHDVETLGDQPVGDSSREISVVVHQQDCGNLRQFFQHRGIVISMAADQTRLASPILAETQFLYLSKKSQQDCKVAYSSGGHDTAWSPPL